MSFQLPPTTTGAATGFTFGLTTSTPAATGLAAPKPTSFSFGATGGGDAGATKPLTFGVPTVAATQAPTATIVPAAIPSTNLGGGFLGAPAAAIATTAAAATTAAVGAAPQPATGFSFGLAPAATATVPAAAATVAPTPSLNLPKTTTPVLGLGAPVTATTTTSAVAPIGGGFANLSTATKTTDSTAVTSIAQMSYNQLEEHINKWTLELEEQEKVFTDQATQINAWDKILINNNQKILELNDAVQKVKSDQQTLEQELEFIATQHKELEESIVPLQKEFLKIPQVDVERSQTYLMVENLDTQLKQMSEDLKEIIDNLNEANKGQDNTDPIIQIGKILNAHMSSLQWIEGSSTSIVNKLDDITKMHESFKRDSERSFRSAYYN